MALYRGTDGLILFTACKDGHSFEVHCPVRSKVAFGRYVPPLEVPPDAPHADAPLAEHLAFFESLPAPQPSRLLPLDFIRRNKSGAIKIQK